MVPDPRNPTPIHPHINVEGGNACLGNVSEMLTRAKAEGRWYDYFTIVVSWANSYNPDDRYHFLREFPRAPDQGTEEVRARRPRRANQHG